MNIHEHRTRQTYESYTFQPLMGFWYYYTSSYSKTSVFFSPNVIEWPAFSKILTLESVFEKMRFRWLFYRIRVDSKPNRRKKITVFLENGNVLTGPEFRGYKVFGLHLVVYGRFAYESFRQSPVRKLIKSFRLRVRLVPHRFRLISRWKNEVCACVSHFFVHGWENEVYTSAT